MMRRVAIGLAASLSPFVLPAQTTPRPAGVAVIVRPARVFDGVALQEGWAVRIRGERIEAAGPAAKIAADGADAIDLPGTTLLPGLIEGHSHVLLHPYNETSWDDQVLKESQGVRLARK